jgi:hypothetical protein
MPPRKEKDIQLTRAKRDESEIDIVEPVAHIKQEEGLLDEDNMPSLVDEVLEDQDDDGEEGEEGEDGEDGEYGDEEMEMYDPTQVLGEIFVTEQGETVADIMADIRNALEKGVKVLFKMSTTLETLAKSKRV